MESLNQSQAPIIKVFGVGGGGCNAVNHMYRLGIEGVDFVVCNTDRQSLDLSPVSYKLQLGTSGLGAGNKPEAGRKAAKESIEEIKKALSDNTKMVFITAGMGGGTGTGGAPIVAQVAKELGILTVGIVTIPFMFEGKRRLMQAEEGIKEMRKSVDALIIISNEKLRERHGDMRMEEALAKADDVLATAAKGIAEIITKPGYINVDFEDVKTVLQDSGVAIMAIGKAEGPNRALEAAEAALNSELLNDSSIEGAENILLYISSGVGEDQITMDEIGIITDHIQNAAQNANLIWGYRTEKELGPCVSVILVAAGFSKEKKNEIEESFTFTPKPKAKIELTTNNEVTRQNQVNSINTPQNEPHKKEEIIIISRPSLQAKQPIVSETQNKTTSNTAPIILEIKNHHEQPKEKTHSEKIKDDVEKMTIQNTQAKQEPEKQEKNQNFVGNIENNTPPAEKPPVEKPIATDKPLHPLEQMPKSQNVFDNTNTLENNENATITKNNETRAEKLRNMSILAGIKKPETLHEIETVPAFQRKNRKLDDVPPSDENIVSRNVITQTSENKTIISPNNTYLFDNVD